MQTLERNKKTYLLDDDGFLLNPGQWDEDFAEGMAPALGIKDGLTPSHWNVLKFIRSNYLETGSCPIVHKTCRANTLKLKDLQELFPSGYQRGACKLAGVSFMAGGATAPYYPAPGASAGAAAVDKKTYRVNVQGFLVDPNEWDEDFAVFKARELQMAEPLSEKQWRIIKHIRSEYSKSGEVPTVYSTCEAIGIDIDEFATLFPSGYHRGAVKIAGLSLAAKRG
jgi:tRNA 2-thiouridine synthesizing protein E